MAVQATASRPWSKFNRHGWSKFGRRQQIKARIRAKVEHPLRVIKQQFGFAKVRYRGLAKNTARLNMLFAMSNLWMARKVILQAGPRPSMA